MAEPWRADEAQEQQAKAIANALGEDLFSHCCDTYRMRMSGVEGTVNVECLDDGPPAGADEATTAAYERAALVLEDPHAWPLVYVDESGRRFEVEVDVTVRALPDVVTQLAEHDRLVAEAAEAVERNKARLSADRPVLPGGLRVRGQVGRSGPGQGGTDA